MSPRTKRTSGPEKFRSSAKKDFFNTIGTFETLASLTERMAREHVGVIRLILAL
jgi:hypothetical protein